jgi:hypothetical protein
MIGRVLSILQCRICVVYVMLQLESQMQCAVGLCYTVASSQGERRMIGDTWLHAYMARIASMRPFPVIVPDQWPGEVQYLHRVGRSKITKLSRAFLLRLPLVHGSLIRCLA